MMMKILIPVLSLAALVTFPVKAFRMGSLKTFKSLVLQMSLREDLRNVAIVAHVDHGKTTLVDSMIRQSGAFRSNQDIESMDNNAQERERGITILAKNAAIMFEGTKINLVDTPGHADFGGEVERIMNMVDGVLLVVDSVDGPKPQTRFVLKKALEKGVRAIVVVNKIDRPQARPNYVIDRVFDLFADLNASDEQMDFQVVYASGMNGIAGLEPDKLSDNLQPLFKEILKLPLAQVDEGKPLQLLIANVDYDDFKGKIGIGRILNGELKTGDDVVYGKPGEAVKKSKVSEVFVFNNVGREKVDRAFAGDIVMITGIDEISIGDTVMDKETPIPLPPITVEEPTVRMSIAVNKSPLGGREGKLLQSRVIRDRLYKELDRNVALKVYETDNSDTYEVCGRGQLHLTVLIENMRREGFELMVGPPTVIEKTINGEKCEPFEVVDVTVPNEFSSSVVSLLNKRKGEMTEMGPSDGSEGQTQLKFLVPTRGMIGIRSALMTATKGTIVLDTQFDSYRPVVGAISQREKGSLLAFEEGNANAFGIAGAQDRGLLFIEPKDEVFKDMIIGIHQRPGDLPVNVCKTKQLTNMRASGSDDTVKLTPPLELNLDIAVEYIAEDELVEVTPTKIRMLKHPDHKIWAKKRQVSFFRHRIQKSKSRIMWNRHNNKTVTEAAAVHDDEGRLLKDPNDLIDPDKIPEDLKKFISFWLPQQVSSAQDWLWTTKFVWPDIDRIVHLKRLDIFETSFPLSQQGTTDIEESRRIRDTEGWYPIRSLFCMDEPFGELTREVFIESTGPPRRHRFRPEKKNNSKDTATWTTKQSIYVYIGSDRVPGAAEVFVDYVDMPDRYFISTDFDVPLGRRRMFRFAAYPATQYYILEKKVYHEALAAEGGYGLTYTIEKGPIIFAKLGWRVIGSFFGFDSQLSGSSQYTVYRRMDPFPRMLIAMDVIDKAYEWDASLKFYAFDIPIPSSVRYALHHCSRSIFSSLAVIPRHRLTTEDPRAPWELRMNIYVMPADLRDCSFSTYMP